MKEKVYSQLKGETLQSWLTIAIIRNEDGDARVETRSTIHVNQYAPVSFTWGSEFTDAEILKDADLLKVVYQRYGYEIFTGKYTRDFK